MVDPLEMRRECLSSALCPWATSLTLDLVATGDMISLPLGNCSEIVLLIINLGGTSVDSLEADSALFCTKALHEARYALISDRADPEEAIAAAERGFQAFLPTALPLEIVKQALTFILGGGTYFPREALLANHSPTVGRGSSTNLKGLSPQGLTGRQNEVLERLRFGKSNKHIARELNMQEATVKVHVRQIMRKLGASNRTQAALLAQISTTKATVEIPQNGAVCIPPMINGTSATRTVNVSV
ncbi:MULTISPECIES: response regulator transcription factor [unclassified Rhizobium]|uniref:response regulator transcription factor n=1 Tax=unclassified Rhizobium TaxID=2613769 RepID=UPI002889637E|nr:MULTISPECIES: response regulator transcription factor [unclassified Rhizobium]